jgi:hypothetical protein
MSPELSAALERIARSGFCDGATIAVARRVALNAEFGDGLLADGYEDALVKWAAQFPVICETPGFDTAWWDLPGLPRVLFAHRRDGGGLSLAWRRVADTIDVEHPNRSRWLRARDASHPGPWLSLRHLAVM